MEISLPQNPAEFNDFIQQLDKVLLERAIEWARKCYKTLLEELDGLLMQNRDRALSVEHRRDVWLQTHLGPVKVKRQQYRDGDGKYRYLLDELMGMGRYRHYTNSVQEKALEMASTMPYRYSA